MQLLDIGGGYPGAHKSLHLFETITKEINESLDKWFSIDEYPNLKIIAEPGRYLVESMFSLCVSIIGKRVENVNDEENKFFMYYMNDGVYGSFSDTRYLDPAIYDIVPEFTKVSF